MSDNQHTDLRLHLLLTAMLLLAAFCGGYEMAKNHFRDSTQKVDTVIVEHWDTLTIDRPTEVVRYVHHFDTIHATDTAIKIIVDTISGASTAIIPIERVIYRDSTENAKYEAFLSGYRARLDSITINCKQTETIITRTEIEKARRLGVGVQVGVGASLQGLTPYVGIGVQYRLW